MALVINGEPIDEAIVEQEFANIKSAYESLDPTIQCCERDGEFRGYAEENVIGRVLLTQEALRAVDPPRAEQVDEAVAKLKEEHGGEQKFYAAFNITAEQDELVRRDVEINLRVQKLLDDATGGDPEPTDGQLRTFYEEQIDRFTTPERVRAAHILKTPRRSEDREPAFQELRDIRRRAVEGEDFHRLALEHSDKVRELRERRAAGEPSGDPAAHHEEDGVDLGYFSRGELMEEFELVAFSLREKEVSPVFGTAFGLHVVKLTERIPPTPRPFEDVREEVWTAYLEENRTAKVQAYVEELKAKARIEKAGAPAAE